MLWHTRFSTLGPFAHLPRLSYMASEVQHDGRYHHYGRRRRGDPQILFKYSLAGTGVLRDAHGTHRVPAGQGFLCEVSDPAIEYYYPTPPGEPWKFVWMTFVGDSALLWTRDLIRNGGPLFTLPRETGVIEHLCSFAKDPRQQRVVRADWGAELVLSLLLALTRSRESGLTHAEAPGIARRAQEFVVNNLDRNISGKEVAEALRVSREHLSRVFHHETGVTLHAFILRQKIDYACHLLRHSDASIKEVAARLGYDSPAHFGRTFRRVAARTPGEYRDQGPLH